MENHKALKTCALISKLADAVQHEVNHLLSYCVVTTSIVVSGIFLARDELFRVVQLAVGTSAYFIKRSGLEINHDTARNVLASSCLGEEGVERIVTAANGLVRRHLAVRLDSVLKAVKLPAGVSGLDTGLAQMKGKAFTHFSCRGGGCGSLINRG